MFTPSMRIRRVAPVRVGECRSPSLYTCATPGVAHVYNEGDLHSPTRVTSTRLIRIEGVNMETVRRFKYVAV